MIMTARTRSWFGVAAVLLLLVQVLWITAVELPIYGGSPAPINARAICFAAGVVSGLMSLVLSILGRGRWRWTVALIAVIEIYYSISVVLWMVQTH
jgi:hypothetical protein